MGTRPAVGRSGGSVEEDAGGGGSSYFSRGGGDPISDDLVQNLRFVMSFERFEHEFLTKIEEMYTIFNFSSSKSSRQNFLLELVRGATERLASGGGRGGCARGRPAVEILK